MIKQGSLVKFQPDSPLRGLFGPLEGTFKVMYAEEDMVCIDTPDPDTKRSSYRELNSSNFEKVS